MKITSTLLLFAVLATTAAKAQTIGIIEEGGSNGSSIIQIQKQQTQTQITPGWKIVDVKLKDKVKRYLYGTCANEFSYTYGTRPKFLVKTDTLLLADLVLIKLKTTKDSRVLPNADIHNCAKTFCDMANFSIVPYRPVNARDDVKESEDIFIIRPLQDLLPGEYVFAWLTAPTIKPYGDWTVWPFSIR